MKKTIGAVLVLFMINLLNAQQFSCDSVEIFSVQLSTINPTVEVVENKIAALEGGVGALCTSSGQSATLLAILNSLK